MGKPKVAFVCVHNSCRSQMAEALGKKLADDVFESYSGGTEVKDRINPDAVRMMKKLHGIDMEESQYSKLVSQLPQPDVVIYMGCNVSCPAFTAPYTENWGLSAARAAVISRPAPVVFGVLKHTTGKQMVLPLLSVYSGALHCPGSHLCPECHHLSESVLHL